MPGWTNRAVSATQTPMVLSWRASLVVRPIRTGELERFNAELSAHHWLGHRLSGRVLRYVATIDSEWVALAGFGSAALSCTAREEFLGWDPVGRICARVVADGLDPARLDGLVSIGACRGELETPPSLPHPGRRPHHQEDRVGR